MTNGVEQEHHVDQGTQLAEGLLGDSDILRRLTDRQERGSILSQVVTGLGDDRVTQATFIRTIFRAMAREGSERERQKHDRSLAILTGVTPRGGPAVIPEELIPLHQTNTEIVFDEYFRLVQQITTMREPYYRRVIRLVNLGRALAPYVGFSTLELRRLSSTWTNVLKQPHQAPNHFLQLEVEELMVSFDDNSLDAKIVQLANQGHSNQAMAYMLGRKVGTIKYRVAELVKLGELGNRIHQTPPDVIAILDPQVEAAMQRGLRTLEIAEELGYDQSEIQRAIDRLRYHGSQVRIQSKGRPPKRSPAETASIDARVESIKASGEKKTNAQIAQELSDELNRPLTERDIRRAVERINKAAGTVRRPATPPRRTTPEQRATLDDDVLRLARQEYTYDQIATELKHPKSLVKSSVARLIRTGRYTSHRSTERPERSQE